LAGGCQQDQQVASDPRDNSRPAVTLDLYGVPKPPQSSVEENPLTVTADCCDVERAVARNSTITALAAGDDAESGVRNTVIFFAWSVDCFSPPASVRSDGVFASPYPTLGLATAPSPDSQREPSDRTLPQRIATQGTLRIADYSLRCRNNEEIHLRVKVWAYAENGAHKGNRSGEVTLTYQSP
jgi:hypothetical protein